MKIKFNELPDGFEVRNGEVVETKQSGGSTGDQKNYGLVVNPKDDYGSDDDVKVNYSMTSVPRDEANIEAEGGETVLTDLNGDGSFNLYDIKGPRHSNGGVPLNLPDQSFVFSDFNKMKFTKNEMAEMGVESKKRLTPAKISKKYGLNEYNALLKDPYVDDIQAKTAELMLDKNKRKLSKLAFMQEEKKDFEDGVPVTAFPFLVEQGQDPIEFTQKVEEISRQQAEQKFIQSLPPEQQMQIAAMQQYMAQVDQQQQAEEQDIQQMPPEMQGMQQMPMQQQGMLPPPGMDNQQLAQMGYEVSSDMGYAQTGGEGLFDILKNTGQKLEYYNILKSKGLWPEILDQYPYLLEKQEIQDLVDGIIQDSSVIEDMNLTPEQLTEYKQQIDNAILTSAGLAEDDPVVFQDPDPVPTKPVQTTTKPKTPSRSRGRGDKTNVAYDDDTFGDVYTKLGITFDPVNINARKYRDVQAQKDTHFGDATENVLGFDSSWADIYPAYDALQEELKRTKGKGSLPQVKEFQKWFNDIYIPQFAEDWVVNHIKEELGGNATADERMSLKKGVIQSMRSDFGFNDNVVGRNFDGKFGTFTSSRRPFGIATRPQEDFPTAEEYKPGQTVDPPLKKDSELEPGDLKIPYSKQDPRFWLQDLLKINAVANRKRKKFYPWQQPVENVEVNWLLEDPTRAIAATNEQLGIMTDAIGAFSGPQSLNARTANAQGKAAANIANVIAGVHNRNINTTNKGLALQTQYDSYINAERRKRSKQLYDDTMKVEQNYMNEKNYDREQLADLVANAYTNAANTYNLNSLYDYYNIDPSTGGLINFTNPKAWDYTEQSEDDYLNRWIDTRKKLEQAGIKDPTQDTINKIMEQYYPNQTKSAMDKARQQYIDTNPFNVDKSSAIGKYRKGKEVNHKLLPFFVGAIGI